MKVCKTFKYGINHNHVLITNSIIFKVFSIKVNRQHARATIFVQVTMLINLYLIIFNI